MVLNLQLHDVVVLVKNILACHLETEVFFVEGSLVSSFQLPPGTLGQVQGSGKQMVRSILEVLMGVTPYVVKSQMRDRLNTSTYGRLHF